MFVAVFSLKTSVYSLKTFLIKTFYGYKQTFLDFFVSLALKLSMSTVRENCTVRRTFKYGTVRYGSFANTYLLDRTFYSIWRQYTHTHTNTHTHTHKHTHTNTHTHTHLKLFLPLTHTHTHTHTHIHEYGTVRYGSTPY